MGDEDASAGRLIQQGLDLVLDWPDFASARLHNWRNTSDGVRGELTVTQNGVKCSWGSWNLASTTTRDALAKRLKTVSPDIPWGPHLEEAAYRFTQAARLGEPLTFLDGAAEDEHIETLLPGWLYAGQPTLLYADGDTGKSMTALALAIAIQTGRSLPGLTPTRAVPSAYLDWETSKATTNTRLRLLSAGLGIAPPRILYKRMTRPLVEEVGALSVELHHRKVGFIVIDSKMFAVSGGEGGAFHEPITAFYNALRLFAPAAVLVLNHITNADARTGATARPFGGAFAFNGPRVIWEAKRDQEIENATAIVFTCRKTNNLARKPDAFGLRFRGADTFADSEIRIERLPLTDVAPKTLAGATIRQRLRILLSAPLSVEDILEAIPGAKEDSVARILRRMKTEYFEVTQLPDGRYITTTPPESGQGGQCPPDSVRAQRLAPTDEEVSSPHPGADGHLPPIGGVRLSAKDHEVAAAQAEPSWITTDPPKDIPL
jgi:AAA domain